MQKNMGRVSLVIIFSFACVLTSVHAVLKCNSTSPCEDYSCCSNGGYCGSTADYCAPSNCLSNCVPYNETVTNITAYWAELNPDNYNLTAEGGECSPWISDYPYEWRSRYEWTAFCGPIGPRGRPACGRCLQVVNLKTNASTRVRIVDECGVNGLVLDRKPFSEIDTDGEGGIIGHLTVSYCFVECGDLVNFDNKNFHGSWK